MTDRERLVQLLAEAEDLPRCQTYEGFSDYLIENGVVVLPCKVGDVVYEIVHGEILETEAVGFLVCQDGTILMITKYSFPLTREIGCCLFLSREEAERAVKGRINK